MKNTCREVLRVDATHCLNNLRKPFATIHAQYGKGNIAVGQTRGTRLLQLCSRPPRMCLQTPPPRLRPQGL